MEMIKQTGEIEYQWIRSHELLGHNHPQAGMLIVDVRTPGEFEEIHIPDSTNVPLADLERALPELESKMRDKQIILVCRTQNRVKVAYNHLARAGMTNCQILEGGMTGWVSEGNPVIKGEKAISLERQVRMVVGVLVVVGAAMGAFLSPWFFLVPAAVGAGLFHAGLTDSCFMGMLLAQLPFNRKWSRKGVPQNELIGKT